jgi:lipopolysaccharide/colanic/teichoic acid biosynthesis glycosyltransferase
MILTGQRVGVVRPRNGQRVRRAVKDALDRGAAVLGLLLLLPVFLAVAAAVRLTSAGPAFFVQTRVGRDGKPFRMVKFRTMHCGADALVAHLMPLNDASGPLFKLREDPRVTRLGRFLRRHSIDELPQLLNVLTGSMSLVGPRPPLPREVASYDALASRRLTVKPGLTGLWQVSSRSDLSWHEALTLDLQYIDRWSLALDLGVLVRTVRAVVCPRGAY